MKSWIRLTAVLALLFVAVAAGIHAQPILPPQFGPTDGPGTPPGLPPGAPPIPGTGAAGPPPSGFPGTVMEQMTADQFFAIAEEYAETTYEPFNSGTVQQFQRAAELYVPAEPVPLDPVARAQRDSHTRRLLAAISANNFAAVADAVYAGADLAHRDETGRTPLMDAVARDARDAASALLQAGAPRSVSDVLGNTAMHLAAAANNVYLVQELASYGVPVDYTFNHQGFTPLLLAAAEGKPEVAGALIDAGASSATTELGNGRTPVRVAADAGHFGVIREMTKRGVPYDLYTAISANDLDGIRELHAEDPEVVRALRPDGVNPTTIALLLGHYEVADLLLQLGANPMANNPDTGITPMTVLVKARNTEGIRRMLMLGANINEKESLGLQETPVHKAVYSDDAAFLQFLIDNGADISVENSQGESPLHVAARVNAPQTAALLATSGANLNKNDNQDRSPLHRAAENGCADIIATLLDAGADIHAKTRDRWTPLHAAVAAQQTEAAALLLERGADLTRKDVEGRSPFLLAVEKGDLALAQLLLEAGADLEDPDKLRRTPLLVALNAKQPEMANFLLEQGADIQATDRNGQSTLVAALDAELSEIARTLIDRGVDISARDRNQRTPMFAAAQNANEANVRMLVDLGADLMVRDRMDLTPLHVAAERGAPETVEYLLSMGAEVDAVDKQGRTPLHIAATRGNILVVKSLVEFHADVFREDRNGQQPIHLAAAGGFWGPIQIFLLRGSDVNVRDSGGNTPLHLAAQEGHARLVRLLLARDADITVVNSEEKSPLELVMARVQQGGDTGLTPRQIAQRQGRQRTVLYLRAVVLDEIAEAIENGQRERLELLLETHPTFINTAIFGMTPLHLAAREGEVDTISALLRHGADPKLADVMGTGRTPLHEAARAGHGPAVRVLLDNGADLAAKDASGLTAAEVAEREGHTGLRNVFAQYGAAAPAAEAAASAAATAN